MLQPEKYTVRVFWQKRGNAKYISHLDTQRAITRALIRSGLPLYYSQGFNPHPKLVFALPVSIYQEALYDVFDVELREKTDPSLVRERLAAAMPGDMPIIGAAYPKRRLKELRYAAYDVFIETDLSPEKVKRAFDGEVMVEKRSKTKTERTDISPLIKSVRVLPAEGGVLLSAVLSASPDAYLNPKYLIEALGDPARPSQTVRTALYDADLALFE